MSDFERLHNQIQKEIIIAFGIPKEYFYRQPEMKTIQGIKDLFKKAGINRYKVIEYDHLNVTLKVPKKHIENVKKLEKEAGIARINYQVKKLWFFQCWFKKIQIVDERCLS